MKSSISKFNSEVPCTFQAERDTSFTFFVADSPLNLTSSECYRIHVVSTGSVVHWVDDPVLPGAGDRCGVSGPDTMGSKVFFCGNNSHTVAGLLLLLKNLTKSNLESVQPSSESGAEKRRHLA